MTKDEEVLRKLIAAGMWITTKQLDQILLEVWSNEYDAKMHGNSLMRRGFIDYYCDGDWKVEITLEELEEIVEENNENIR